MHVGIAKPRGKRSRHSQRMRNLEFYVFGKRPIATYSDEKPDVVIMRVADICVMSHHIAGSRKLGKHLSKVKGGCHGVLCLKWIIKMCVFNMSEAISQTSLQLKSWSCFNYSYREFPLANSVFLWHQRHLRERWFDSWTRMKDCYDTAQLDSWMPPKTEWPLLRNEGRLIYVGTKGSCIYSIYLLLWVDNCFYLPIYFNGN